MLIFQTCHYFPPAPCDGIPEPCEEGENYADATSCFSYFQCINSVLVFRSCSLGFAFDIYTRECITPDSSFDCNYRCLTTIAPTAIETTAPPGSTIGDLTTGDSDPWVTTQENNSPVFTSEEPAPRTTGLSTSAIVTTEELPSQYHCIHCMHKHF